MGSDPSQLAVISHTAHAESLPSH